MSLALAILTVAQWVEFTNERRGRASNSLVQSVRPCPTEGNGHWSVCAGSDNRELPMANVEASYDLCYFAATRFPVSKYMSWTVRISRLDV